MANKKRVRAGDLIKVPFKEGVHTYGRALIEGSYAFYDCPSTVDREDYNAIIESDILFIARVDIFAINKGYWTVLKNIPLEDRLKNYYPRYFNTLPTKEYNFGFYNVYKEEIENAIARDWIKTDKIQLEGIYGNIHIEERLRDYYEGRRNESNTWHIWSFKKGFGLITLTYDEFQEKLNKLPTTAAL